MFEYWDRGGLMEITQEALLLVLQRLGVAPDITTTSKRKSVQKAVYLSQAAGVDLGYRYNWYKMGPYSPALTRDYFSLRDSLLADPGAEPAHRLSDVVERRLARLPTLFSVPADAKGLTQADWLELLASVHYLIVRRRDSESEAAARLREEKPHVAAYFDLAKQRLAEHSLI